MVQQEHLRVRHLTWEERDALQDGIPTIERALENRGPIDVNISPKVLCVLLRQPPSAEPESKYQNGTVPE